MFTTNIANLLGRSSLAELYQVDFYNENEKVVAKIYQATKKIGECILEDLPIGLWKYDTLPDPARLKIDQIMIEQKIQIESIMYKLKWLSKKDPESAQISYESDEELAAPTARENTFIFQKQASIDPTVTTISCQEQNIKGSTLIEIVHDTIQEWYEHVIDYACEYEKELGGAVISPPSVKDGILSVRAPKDWFMSLGGWKGMMPSEEIKEYFFYRFEPEKEERKFCGVRIYADGLIYRIIDGRLHLPEKFSINQVDVTGFWRKNPNGEWVRIPSGKTDLSYPQILDAIKEIKNSFNLDDSKIATLQLGALSHAIQLPLWFKEQIPKENQPEILLFLNYLNGLMFGIEASGLNASLATSLMTLDLIADGKIDYQTAFKANNDGGVYPYACFGNNKGTYSERERILLHNKNNRNPFSMKDFRENTSLSPVAVKEAALIKTWLELNHVVADIDYSTQIGAIKCAIKDLVDYYYSPWVNRFYVLKKFSKR